MQPRVRKLLADMLGACDTIERYCAGRQLDEYRSDDILQDAVERQLMILGEAFYQISKLDPDWETLLTESRQIVRFRHVIVHGYDEPLTHRVWRVVTNALPSISQELRELLGQSK